MNILVLNPGSSTLKFGLYQIAGLNQASAPRDSATKDSATKDSATVLVNGIIESIGMPQAHLTLSAPTQKAMIETVEAQTGSNGLAASQSTR